MESRIYIPHANPVKYTRVAPELIPQYLSKHMDDYPFVDTIRPWQQMKQFLQPYGTVDTIPQQVRSNYAPIILKVLDADGVTRHTAPFDPKQQDFYNPGWFIYENTLLLNAFAPGVYFLQMEVGNPVALTLISEPIKISNSLSNTLLLEFKHHRYYADLIFETGFSPSIRITGSLNLKTPQSKDTLFEDQVLGTRLINSKPFRVWELLLGGASGFPPWMIDKLNLVLGCSTLSIDGRQYTKSVEGSKLEEKSAGPNYPMRGWSIDLREKYTRYSQIYENEVAFNGQMVAIANVDSKGFGTQGGGNIQQITDVF